MPHLSPLSWLSMVVILWYLLTILLTSMWWSVMTMTPTSHPTTNNYLMNWEW